MHCSPPHSGNLLCFNFGLMFGITPAHMSLYESETKTPLNKATDPSGTAWLTGYLFLSAAIGALISGVLALRIGPKSVLLCSGMLQIFGWFCIHFGFDIVHIYASRMFSGVAAGAAFVVLPIFINEISETREKAARLTFTIELWRTTGILLGIVLGFYVPYDLVNIFGCAVSFVFTMSFPFVQESPHFYMRNENVACLEKSLRWYRGIRDMDDREKPEYVGELEEFKAEMQCLGKNIGTAPMPQSYIVRLIFVSFLLTVCAKLSGVFVELNYAADFLGRTGYSMETNYVLLAGAQCVGALLARVAGPGLPRKLLLCLSSLMSAGAVIALALFKQFGRDWLLGNVWCERYLPIFLLALQLLFVSFGLYPLAAVVSSEVLPTKLHDVLYSLASAFSWLLLFGMIEAFNAVKTSIAPGLVLYLWVFAGASIFVGLISLPLLPETRNRRKSSVQRQLGYVDDGDVAKGSAIANGHHISTHI
ncbi:blast:Facilitated trehalose transporter Tret1 [Drosophila guanche]|uniref:Blast:Facilitated trehalose transporter Tret1 n=1 Tax=Drosophila guanche TaxID=7266 RepID=A0A3B0JF09_DROGU|nr:blast:Facilitated trehalose transporter Tret1 [Drosophila guanche]